MKLIDITLVVLASISLGEAGSAQGRPQDAYGATAEQLESLRAGSKVPGWVPLSIGLDLPPTVVERAPRPCTDYPHFESTSNVEAWPGGIIPFEFDANVLPGQQTAATAAMGVLASLADVTFILRTDEPDYIHIQDDTENSSSSIGFRSDETTLRIFNWNIQGIIVHEFLHALGYHHEQQRPDRGTYVRIVWRNVQPGEDHNFERRSSATTFGPYDFSSLMQYDGCEFSTCCTPGGVCGCPAACETILTQPAYSEYQQVMGQRDGMSPLDVHGLRSLYPHSSWRFVDPDGSDTGTGTGLDPWPELTTALENAPSGGTVFAMPGTYTGPGLYDRPMIIEAPIGGVVLR